MAQAKKDTKRNGGRKKSSTRRSSKSKKQKRGDLRWLHTLVAIVVTSTILFLAFHLVLKKNFFRFTICEGTKAYQTCLPKGYPIFGLDISHHQGEIKWEKLKNEHDKNAPLRFVYIKATEGRNHKDTRFDKNWKEAKKNGFVRGAYHYFTIASSGETQANMFIKNVKLEKGDLPPVIDIEEKPKDREKFKTELKTFIQKLEKHYGVKPIIYSYPKFHKSYLNDPFFKGYEMWVAHYYVKKPEIKREWTMWQFTDIGRVPGIKQNVDINVIKGGEEKLRELQIK